MTATFSGAASAGDSGGRNVAFSAYSPASWAKLYWGSSSAALPKAGLSGVLNSMTFAGIGGGGTTATWDGSTSWTNPGPGAVGPHTVPTRMIVTITAGAVTWVTSGSLPGLDPGPGTGIGAAIVVANGSAAVNFTVNVQFLADIPTDGSGYIPINSISQGTGGATVSSFTGAFYSKP